ncbi:MAG: hypothetical protein L0H93_21185 [Nocardioides sp.]|nr:hypothetical protein [Nocardioides sp.]
MSGQFWGNEELGSLSQAAKSGHGTAGDEGTNARSKHQSRTEGTEGLNVGPAGNAQRAAHSGLASATQAQANEVSRYGGSISQGERVQGQTTEETSSIHSASASDTSAQNSALKRPISS